MSLDRRGFLGLSALAALPLIEPQVLDPARPDALAADDGELVHVGPTRDPVRIKVAPTGGGRLAMITQDVSPGSVIPIHLHERDDEVIFIQSGTGRGSVGDREVELGPGSMLWVPQGTWHGGANTGSGILKWVAIYSPAGFEGYFREIGVAPGQSEPPRFTAESIAALNRRYGIRYPD